MVRDREHFEFKRSEGAYFWMRDGAKHVLCKVSHEALRDRSACDGENASLSDTFVRHRQRIEMIAGQKYHEAHRANDRITAGAIRSLKASRQLPAALKRVSPGRRAAGRSFRRAPR